MSDIPILYLDEALIVIDKPSGLLAVPGRGADKQDCAASRLQQIHPEALVVHRLDRDTSGLMLFARNAEVHRQVSKRFENREVEKEYVAIVEGIVEADEGRIDLPLRKCFERPPRHRVDSVHGKPATTRWRVIERYADFNRHVSRPKLRVAGVDQREHPEAVHWGLRCATTPATQWTTHFRNHTRMLLLPETGRSHQLRIHMQQLRDSGGPHPIVGDPLYGSGQEEQTDHRLMLHATKLKLLHPSRGETTSFRSECPF